MTTDVDLELVRELHPEGDGPSPETRRRARAVLLIELDNDGGARRMPKTGRKRLRLPLLSSLGVAGTGIAIVLVLVLGAALQNGVTRPASAAAAMLQRAARAAEASGGPRELRPGEYWYVHSRDTNLGVMLSNRVQIVDALGSTDRQIWIGLDATSRLSTHVIGPIEFLSARARKQWERAGRPSQAADPRNLPLPSNAFAFPYRKLLALPSNVDSLWRVVKQDAGKGSAAWVRHEMFTVIGDLLREDPVPARVRAALYLVAARIPGIQMLGLTHDGIGRPALAITLNDSFNQEREELLFDPRTAKLLGERQTVVTPNRGFHVKPGTIESESTYLASGIVQRIGQRPR
jgi:hypothetical protein